MCISSALLALVDADKQNYNAVMGLLWLVSAVGDRELSHIENSYEGIDVVDTRRLLVDAAYPLEHNGSAKITACID